MLGPRNQRVQEPDGGHVVPGRVEGHGEFEDEDLLRAAEAVVGGDAGAVVAAVTAGAGCAGEDGEFSRGGNGHVGEDLGGGGCFGAVA